MLARDEEAVSERCSKLSATDRSIDVMVGDYYDQNNLTPVNVIECNRIRQVVSQPEYIRNVAITQLQSEGVLLVER